MPLSKTSVFLTKSPKLASILPYLELTRIHRPHGIWLLLFPGWWGLALHQVPSPSLLLLFALGAILMRSAGCIYNDIIDKDLDKHVNRTASRPLAKGAISLKNAWLFCILLILSSGFILLQLPFPAIGIGCLSLVLICLYPWMKRLTYWPQAFLGITYNIGVLMGALSVSPSLSPAVLFFYGGGILWTLGFDTIYGLQDKEDDIRVGIKSSALVVAPYIKLFLSLSYGGALALWGIGSLFLTGGIPFWIAWILCAVCFAWQIFSLKKDLPFNCLTRFKANSLVGFLLFLGLVFSHLIL